MSGVSDEGPSGVIRPGWRSFVGDYAIAVEWIVDSKAIAVADAAGGLYAYEGASGKQRWALVAAHDGPIMAMTRDPSGHALATAGQDGRVQVWDARTGARGLALAVSETWVEHVAWSPGGRYLAAASGRTVQVWSADGEPVWRFDGHPSTVSTIAWVTDAELSVTCYGEVVFYQLPSGNAVQRLQWKGSLVSIALSPDGSIVACGSQDNTVHFWRRASGQDSMMSGYPNKPSALAFDARGELLATGGSHAITVWSFAGDGPEGCEPGLLALHAGPITTLRFAHRGRRLASGSRDTGVIVWELDAVGAGKPIGLATAGGVVEALRWRPDDRALVAIDGVGAVSCWRVR